MHPIAARWRQLNMIKTANWQQQLARMAQTAIQRGGRSALMGAGMGGLTGFIAADGTYNPMTNTYADPTIMQRLKSGLGGAAMGGATGLIAGNIAHQMPARGSVGKVQATSQAQGAAPASSAPTGAVTHQGKPAPTSARASQAPTVSQAPQGTRAMQAPTTSGQNKTQVQRPPAQPAPQATTVQMSQQPTTVSFVGGQDPGATVMGGSGSQVQSFSAAPAPQASTHPSRSPAPKQQTMFGGGPVAAEPSASIAPKKPLPAFPPAQPAAGQPRTPNLPGSTPMPMQQEFGGGGRLVPPTPPAPAPTPARGRFDHGAFAPGVGLGPRTPNLRPTPPQVPHPSKSPNPMQGNLFGPGQRPQMQGTLPGMGRSIPASTPASGNVGQYPALPSSNQPNLPGMGPRQPNLAPTPRGIAGMGGGVPRPDQIPWHSAPSTPTPMPMPQQGMGWGSRAAIAGGLGLMGLGAYGAHQYNQQRRP